MYTTATGRMSMKNNKIELACFHRANLTLEVTNDNFHGVHRLELYIGV